MSVAKKENKTKVVPMDKKLIKKTQEYSGKAAAGFEERAKSSVWNKGTKKSIKRVLEEYL